MHHLIMILTVGGGGEGGDDTLLSVHRAFPHCLQSLCSIIGGLMEEALVLAVHPHADVGFVVEVAPALLDLLLPELLILAQELSVQLLPQVLLPSF